MSVQAKQADPPNITDSPEFLSQQPVTCNNPINAPQLLYTIIVSFIHAPGHSFTALSRFRFPKFSATNSKSFSFFESTCPSTLSRSSSNALEDFEATAITASTLAPLYRAPPISHLHATTPSRQQDRDLPGFKKTTTSAEDGRHSLPNLDPISRPSSTSTQASTLHHSASLPQLPGLSALASVASTSNSPILRYVFCVAGC